MRNGFCIEGVTADFGTDRRCLAKPNGKRTRAIVPLRNNLLAIESCPPIRFTSARDKYNPKTLTTPSIQYQYTQCGARAMRGWLLMYFTENITR